MVIVHYLMGLPPRYSGGLVTFALDLARQQAMNSKVVVVIPGKTTIKKKECRFYRIASESNLQVMGLENALPVAGGLGISQPQAFMEKRAEDVFEKFFSAFQPDVFHIHSLMGLPLEFLIAAKKNHTKIVFTTHDFYGLCTKPDFCNYSGAICERADWSQCEKCCRSARSVKRLALEQSKAFEFALNCPPLRWSKEAIGQIRRKRRERTATSITDTAAGYCEEYLALERYYQNLFQLVDIFHYNSYQTKQIYDRFSGKKKGIVFPILTAQIMDRRSRHTYQKGALRLAFMGSTNPSKGLVELVKAIDRAEEKNPGKITLDIYCDADYAVGSYIHRHKPYAQSDLPRVYQNVDAVVVPSRWWETFCFVVLESISFGIPVICSDLVGAKDIVSKYDCGFVFHSFQQLDQLLEQLPEHPELLEKKNANILQADLCLSYDGYADGLRQMVYSLQ